MSAHRAPPHILIVDDCTITCNLLTTLLTAEGYCVTAAHEGMSGLAAARSQSPDLAIVDLHLPDLSGIELAGLLQPEIPFLALTIERSTEAVQRCIEKGALGYLVKPLEAESFLRHVTIALERGREQRNLRRALQDNHVINKALGVLMGFLQIPERQAFNRLVARASTHRMKAVAVAENILAASETLSATPTPPHEKRSTARAFLKGFRTSD